MFACCTCGISEGWRSRISMIAVRLYFEGNLSHGVVDVIPQNEEAVVESGQPSQFGNSFMRGTSRSVGRNVTCNVG